MAVGEGRLVGETRQPRLEQLRVQSHAHTLALVKLWPATERDSVNIDQDSHYKLDLQTEIREDFTITVNPG